MSEFEASTGDRLFALLQQSLPTRALSALMYRVAEWRNPRFKSALIDWFMRRYRIDLSEAEFERPQSYDNFNAFFTRALKAGARPQPDDIKLLSSPVDGTLSQYGAIVEGALIQAKGRDYTAAELLADDDLAARFWDGSFCTIYLAPNNYHRVHMPCAGVLRRWSYIPGRLFSVNPSTARALPKLFARNERMVACFDTDFGPLALVMVGAMIVGGIETVWGGRITPPHRRQPEPLVYEPMQPLSLQRGDELGRFHLGSTVILLAPAAALQWLPQWTAGAGLRLGDALAAVSAPSSRA
ncbi:MAG: phosphatidylserine decarboxylase [Nevskia sp.]|nr:phosphatidylserine decarboxylase [Nevskia sp.]